MLYLMVMHFAVGCGTKNCSSTFCQAHCCGKFPRWLIIDSYESVECLIVEFHNFAIRESTFISCHVGITGNTMVGLLLETSVKWSPFSGNTSQYWK